MFQGIQAVALPMVQEFGYTREIEDRVLAPLPVWLVAIQKVAGGRGAGADRRAASCSRSRAGRPGHAGAPRRSTGWCCSRCLPLASVHRRRARPLVRHPRRPPQVPLIFGIIVIPITFLGCDLLPVGVARADPVAAVAVLVNPLVYMCEGLRVSLTPYVEPCRCGGSTAA